MSGPDASPPSRYSPGRGRSAGFFLALLAEALLVLIVLGFGSSIMNPESFGSAVDIVRFRAVSHEETPEPAEEKPAPAEKQAEPQPKETAEPEEPDPVPEPPPPQPEPPQPRKPPPVPKTIPLAPPKAASPNVAPARPSAPPPAAKGQQFGPPDTVGRAADTPVVSGSGPNGEKLYAAAWYREPYADELSGYLSTATGPGWGLIACRTAEDFRVEDCVAVDEYPAGSNINRAILAAAWQFKVRPPRIGGQTRVGEWVRIRIDYGTRRN